MILKQTKLKIFDNSGAVQVKCIHLLKYKKNGYSKIGDVLLTSVLKHKPNRKISKKQLCKILLITTKKKYLRLNGNSIKCDETRAITISNLKKPIGTRIFSPIASELKNKQNMRLISLSKGFI